ncbi:MAG: hypothetical protein EBX30_14910 [Betaproteobacteria bacterium]|nr:hypothetical protein [Betaproteobacteria bacterium]NDG82208.1 hypothetical protein [Betaproteobacteria bacterium]
MSDVRLGIANLSKKLGFLDRMAKYDCANPRGEDLLMNFLLRILLLSVSALLVTSRGGGSLSESALMANYSLEGC